VLISQILFLIISSISFLEFYKLKIEFPYFRFKLYLLIMILRAYNLFLQVLQFGWQIFFFLLKISKITFIPRKSEILKCCT